MAATSSPEEETGEPVRVPSEAPREVALYFVGELVVAGGVVEVVL
jgi:hypothetical protein